MMKAIQANESEQGLTLSIAEVERPEPGPGQLLIRVHAVGVTTTELNWYPTTHTPSGQKRLHAIPGHEFSGVIAKLGQGTSGFVSGQEIYGMNDWFQDGATAAYCLASPWSIAGKPASLTHIEAATVPIGFLTAWQGLFEKAALQSGERVLVQGAAGAVGLFAVQLAHLHGGYVIATASSATIPFVRSLGANEVIDYKAARFEEFAGRIDVVFDTVGGETRERSRAVLKPGGRMVSIAADGEVNTDPKIRDAYFIVEPNRMQLIEAAKLLDEGRLKAFVKAVVPLADAAQAYAGSVERKLGFGKLVIEIPAEAAGAEQTPNPES
jgi:NADPH:quinone reductase-like Zn-dependent oxidoreductase